jgi:hypothetical protein
MHLPGTLALRRHLRANKLSGKWELGVPAAAVCCFGGVFEAGPIAMGRLHLLGQKFHDEPKLQVNGH